MNELVFRAVISALATPDDPTAPRTVYLSIKNAAGLAVGSFSLDVPADVLGAAKAGDTLPLVATLTFPGKRGGVALESAQEPAAGALEALAPLPPLEPQELAFGDQEPTQAPAPTQADDDAAAALAR